MPRHGFGALLSDAQWVQLLRRGIHRRFDDGDVIIGQGELDSTVFLLVEGTVKVTSDRPEGGATLLALRCHGEALGEFSALSGLARTATVTACGGPCQTRALGGPHFILLVRRLGLEAALWKHMVLRHQESEAVRSDIIALPAGQRLAAALLRLIVILGVATPGSSEGAPGVVLRLGLSQREIGDWIGLSRSSVAAEFKWLRDEGIVDTRRHRITILDLAKLRRFSRGDP